MTKQIKNASGSKVVTVIDQGGSFYAIAAFNCGPGDKGDVVAKTSATKFSAIEKWAAKILS